MQFLIDEWHHVLSFTPRIAAAAAILLISYLAGKFLATIIISLLHRTPLKQIHESFFATLALSVALFFGIIVALNIVGLEKLAVSALAGGGITAIVVGFAFREIGENFLAGLFLAFGRPFNTGDAIKTEDIEGQVRSIELRYTHLRTDDGRDVYVPSAQLFNRPVTNFTKDGLRRISFTVGIDYADDAKQACVLLRQAIASVDTVLDEPPAGAYIAALAPQVVEIQLFYWVDVFDRSADVLRTRTDVMDTCRKLLLEHGYTVSAETTTNIAIVADVPPNVPGLR